MRYDAVLLFVIVQQCFAWDSEQLEVFDVVEEVKENFYEMFNLTNNATSKEIRTAFRRLSLVLHPDKNPNENADVQFRNLVSVYEVLKDDKKRAYYNEVLVNGMPNWKSAMFYYRRVRKMGIMEGAIIIFTIFTIGQYLVAWAAYLEKLYTLEQQAKPRKSKRGTAQQHQGSMPVEAMQKPSVFNTLPFQIPYWSFVFIVSLPTLVMGVKERIDMHKQMMELKREQEEREEEERRKPRETKKRTKKIITIPEGPTFEYSNSTSQAVEEETVNAPPVSGGFWGDDDLDELVHLVKKYPGGTPRRWEVIAECMGRSVAEVTFMANRMKANGYRQQQQQQQDDDVVEEKVKSKTKGGKMGDGRSVEETVWTQQQQKALEDALNKLPKGATDRWDRIADLVPSKSKEECILRYKHLVEVIKKQKQAKEE